MKNNQLARQILYKSADKKEKIKVMTKGQIEYAEKNALNIFDTWCEETGRIPLHSGYYYEVQSIIQDAVHIGIQMAVSGEIQRKEDGSIIHKS